MKQDRKFWMVLNRRREPLFWTARKTRSEAIDMVCGLLDWKTRKKEGGCTVKQFNAVEIKQGAK